MIFKLFGYKCLILHTHLSSEYEINCSETFTSLLEKMRNGQIKQNRLKINRKLKYPSYTSLFKAAVCQGFYRFQLVKFKTINIEI